MHLKKSRLLRSTGQTTLCGHLTYRQKPKQENFFSVKLKQILRNSFHFLVNFVVRPKRGLQKITANFVNDARASATCFSEVLSERRSGFQSFTETPRFQLWSIINVSGLIKTPLYSRLLTSTITCVCQLVHLLDVCYFTNYSSTQVQWRRQKKTLGGGKMTSSLMTSLEIATESELRFPATNFLCCSVFIYTVLTEIFGFALDHFCWQEAFELHLL